MEREPVSRWEGRAVLGTAVLTIASLVAFAGNSILCRMALLPGADGEPAIGPAGFTSLRLLSGALALAPVLLRRQATSSATSDGHALARLAPAAVLLVYAIAFSLSYVTLPAGVGALILFGTVQLVMIAVALRAGERLDGRAAAGLLAASFGMVVLVLPGVPVPFLLAATSAEAPGSFDLFSVAMMAIAGVGWAGYTLLGRGATRPIRMTAANFARCAPAALLLFGLAAWREDAPWTATGVALSFASGAITSGAGYALWYTALSGHTRTSAAVVQLTVPVIAVLGGVVLLDEELTRRIVVAGLLVLGGVAAVLVRRQPV